MFLSTSDLENQKKSSKKLLAIIKEFGRVMGRKKQA